MGIVTTTRVAPRTLLVALTVLALTGAHLVAALAPPAAAANANGAWTIERVVLELDGDTIVDSDVEPTAFVHEAGSTFSLWHPGVDAAEIRLSCSSTPAGATVLDRDGTGTLEVTDAYLDLRNPRGKPAGCPVGNPDLVSGSGSGGTPPEPTQDPEDEPETDPGPQAAVADPQPEISIDKTVADGVEFDDDGDAYVEVTGGATHDITYEFEITNTGTEELTDLTLTDDKIGDLTAELAGVTTDGVLGVEESVTVTAVHEDVGADTFDDSLLVNVGVVTATGADSGERVSARDDETVIEVELVGSQTPAPPDERPSPPTDDERPTGVAGDEADSDEAAGDERVDDEADGDGVDDEVEVLAEVLTDPDARESLPETGLDSARLALLGLLLTVLGTVALTGTRRAAPGGARRP